jgi:hypothetical protein
MTQTPFKGVCIYTGQMMSITLLHVLSFMICATPCSYSDQVFDTWNVLYILDQDREIEYNQFKPTPK